MSAAPALLSRPLDWKFAPSNMLYWADGFDGYRYRIAAEGDSMDGIVHTTFFKMGVPDDAGENVDDVVVSRYPNAAAAMTEAQRHQDQKLLAWLHPQAKAQLHVGPAVDMSAPDTAERVVEKRRSADRTWSVPEMVDRLHRALIAVVDAGDTLVPCLQGPAADAPNRADHDRAVGAYIEHFRQSAFTHERVEALADYLSRMTPPTNGVELTGSADYRTFCAEEYRLARETYDAQRAVLRDILHLGENDPEVLCMVPPPADAVASTLQLDRVVLGHGAEGYLVGLLPEQPEDSVSWSAPMKDRTVAIETAWQIHRDSPELALMKDDAMAMDEPAVGGLRP